MWPKKYTKLLLLFIIWRCNEYTLYKTVYALISGGGFAFFLVFIMAFSICSYLGFTSSSKYFRSFKYFCFTFENVLPFSLQFGASRFVYIVAFYIIQTNAQGWMSFELSAAGWCAFNRIWTSGKPFTRIQFQVFKMNAHKLYKKSLFFFIF